MQLKSYINCLEDNVAFCEASEDEVKNELAVAINDSIQLSQVVHDIYVKVVHLQD